MLLKGKKESKVSFTKIYSVSIISPVIIEILALSLAENGVIVRFIK